MFLAVSVTLGFMDMTDAERTQLGERVASQRRRLFATKSAAYKAADLNPATWERIESGKPVREDRLIAAIKTLWPQSGGDWRRIGSAIAQFEGPSTDRRPYVPAPFEELIRRSILDDDEHSEWEQWAFQVEVTRRIVERMTGTLAEPGDQALRDIRNAIQHNQVNWASIEAACDLLADYVADVQRGDIHQDHRARLLFAFSRTEGAPPAFTEDLVRRFGELGPDIDPAGAASAVDLRHTQIDVEVVEDPISFDVQRGKPPLRGSGR